MNNGAHSTRRYSLSEERKAPPRILVADDDASFGASVRAMLSRLGSSVELVSDGRKAVEAASRERFDFVFLDVEMPEMGGFEAAASIRADSLCAKARIIGISAHEHYASAHHDAGMDAFLVKPVRLDELLNVVGPLAPPR